MEDGMEEKVADIWLNTTGKVNHFLIVGMQGVSKKNTAEWECCHLVMAQQDKFLGLE
jgi:hypothetical protein